MNDHKISKNVIINEYLSPKLNSTFYPHLYMAILDLNEAAAHRWQWSVCL